MLKNELFYSYIDECDKEAIAIENAFDIEMAKLDLAYEYADRLFDIKLMEADARVLNESGTYEDIDNLYAEAGAEAGSQKEGIFKRILNTILGFINSAIESIRGFFKKTNPKLDQAKKEGWIDKIKVKVPNLDSVISSYNNFMINVDKVLQPAYTVTNADGERVFNLAKTLANIILGLTFVKVATAEGGAMKLVDLVENLWKKNKERIQNALNKSGDIKGEGTKKVTDGLNNVLKALNSLKNKLLSSISGAIEKAWNMFSSEKGSKDTEKQNNDSTNKENENPKTNEEQTTPTSKEDEDQGDMVTNGMESADDFIADQELMETCDDILDLIDNL